MRFSELEGARIGVWGAGREIRSFSAQLARRLPGTAIAVVASDSPLDAEARAAVKSPGARFISGPDLDRALAACDIVVRSPGVSIYRSEVIGLKRRGVVVTTATALWLHEHGGRRVIGITGTKGKSTTAALTAHLARAVGLTANLAGNIGVPALDLLDAPEADVSVLELSSYQIADLEAGPEIAVVTNLYREHTDWHGSEDVYRADKLRLLALPGVRVAVVNGRDETMRAAAEAAPSTALYGVPNGWDVAEDGIRLRGELRLPRAELPLLGTHNALNVCAALTALELLGASVPARDGLFAGFEPLAHRLEIVLDAEGVTWIDDSISTTPESTLAAIESLGERRFVLIAGGHDRGQDYTALGHVLARREAVVVALPVTGDRVIRAARAAGVPDECALAAEGLEHALDLARPLLAPGMAVLLSPAAPSYGAYRDFIERGEHFRALIGAGAA
jgi:UDP-N-acetylmuramoylalanine--D-glutamate ligase